MTEKKKRLALFIDGANNTVAIRKSRTDMNLRAFLKQLRTHYDVISAKYYSGTSEAPEHEGVKTYLNYLKRSGYTLVTKPVTCFGDGSVKANMDIEIAVDVMNTAGWVDCIMLFSGDGDFVYLVKEVQSVGTKVIVCSYGGTTSELLKAQADEFLELSELVGN